MTAQRTPTDSPPDQYKRSSLKHQTQEMSEVNNSASRNICSDMQDFVLPLTPYLPCPYNRKYAVYFIPLLFYMLSLLGIIGNLGSLWSCLRPSQPWSIGSIGVLNMAISDLAYLVSMTPWAIYMSADYNWRMGHLLCIIMNILYFVGLTSSTMFICAISADRLLAIVYPLESRMIRTTRNTALVSLFLWAITALLIYLSYPSIIYRARMNGIHVCGAVVASRYNASKPSYDLLTVYSIQVFVPLLLIIPSYLKIMARVKQSRRLWSQVRDKTILFIRVFIANFLICWLPGQVLHIVACLTFLTLNNCKNTCWVAWVVNLLVEASELLYSLNACLDPLIFHMHQPYMGQLYRAVGWFTSCGQRCLQKVGKEAALPVEPVP